MVYSKHFIWIPGTILCVLIPNLVISFRAPKYEDILIGIYAYMAYAGNLE